MNYDPLEAMEAKIENWAFENIRDDEFRCANCDQWTPLNQAIASSPSPFALPLCPKCSGE